MKKAVKSILNNKSLIVAIVLIVVLFVLDIFGVKLFGASEGSSMGVSAIKLSWFNFISMLKIVPPIFLLIGLLDVWVPKETMIKLMGDKSGIVGVLIAFFLGTLTAGPLIAAFPVAMLMLKKGARYSNVLFFIMIWASSKLPILFYQATTLGLKYTLVSNVTLIVVYLIGSIIIEKLLSKEDLEQIQLKAEQA